jgi:FixJ family two-component response regulator
MIVVLAAKCYYFTNMGDVRAKFSNAKGLHEKVVSLIGVVDDDESIRDALSSLLRSAGYKCALFPSAEAFLESGRLSETDCMLLDIQMPGLTGLELQLQLREMKCSIPVIFVTAHADHHLRAKALAQGATAFFGKPFSDGALLGAINSALHSTKQ